MPQLKPNPDRPNVLWLQRTLLPGETAFVPGNVLHDRLHRADRPLPSSRRSAGEVNLSGMTGQEISPDLQSGQARLPSPTHSGPSAFALGMVFMP